MIKERGFDLDIKNPTSSDEEHEFTSLEIVGLLQRSFEKSNELLSRISGEIR